jgi:hypothetical protein
MQLTPNVFAEPLRLPGQDDFNGCIAINARFCQR